MRKRATANPSVVLREEFDDWAVLFDADSGQGSGLNPVGVAVWKLLDGRHSVAAIADVIRAQFDDVPPDVESDIDDLVETLVSKGLATLADEA